jgi:hypothetical protein
MKGVPARWPLVVRLVAVTVITMSLGALEVAIAVARGPAHHVKAAKHGKRRHSVVPRLVGKPSDVAECEVVARHLRIRWTGQAHPHRTLCDFRGPMYEDPRIQPRVTRQRPRPSQRVRVGTIVVLSTECTKRSGWDLPKCNCRDRLHAPAPPKRPPPGPPSKVSPYHHAGDGRPPPYPRDLSCPSSSRKGSRAHVVVPRLRGIDEFGAECSLSERHLRLRWVGQRKVRRPFPGGCRLISGPLGITSRARVTHQFPRPGVRVRTGTVVVLATECTKRSGWRSPRCKCRIRPMIVPRPRPGVPPPPPPPSAAESCPPRSRRYPRVQQQ